MALFVRLFGWRSSVSDYESAPIIAGCGWRGAKRASGLVSHRCCERGAEMGGTVRRGAVEQVSIKEPGRARGIQTFPLQRKLQRQDKT